MQGFKVGHATNHEKGTGLTVFLFDEAIGAYHLCGLAPATHEIAVLDPENSVQTLHALMLTGGSAYGLSAVSGVMTYLAERQIGFKTPHGVVPIVPAAAIYDLTYKSTDYPKAEDAYQACLQAHADCEESGQVGVGTGATIGKLIPEAKSMTSGLGRALLRLPNGVEVIAYAAVNSVGDVRDRKDHIIAGAKDGDVFADCERYLLSGYAEANLFAHTHTTCALAVTNAKCSKVELKRMSKMAAAGMARAISPIFTPYDGDIIFCVSVGDKITSALTLGAMAAEALRLAIIDAVKDAEVLI